MSRVAIPTPEELKAQHEAEIGPRVDAAVTRIVAEMRRARLYMGQFCIPLQKGESELEVELRAAFSGRGWHVHFQDDQREGPHITLRPWTQADR